MFDAIAPRYDLLNAVLSLGVDRGWRREAVVWATAKEPLAVLDVATGTADLAIALRRAAPAPTWSASTSPSRCSRSAGRRPRDAASTLRLEVADGADLPFADASFDAVTIAYGLRNFADIDAGLREFRRVLRPGGRLVVLEFPPPPAGPFGRLFRAYFARVVPWLGGLVSGGPRRTPTCRPR
jgi:demethylmenaquinone methyltransferase / 2-methoxy-6-polyprenyl-1,4-benzoquinol methylase